MPQTPAVIDLTADSDLEDACNPIYGSADGGTTVRAAYCSSRAYEPNNILRQPAEDGARALRRKPSLQTSPGFCEYPSVAPVTFTDPSPASLGTSSNPIIIE
jgi:hypothetical protein